jgi:uncharacterized membrane protein
VANFLIAAGAGLAVLLEMLEACAIVLAVGVSRRWDDALIGAAAGALACALLALLAGPVLLAGLSGDVLHAVIGGLLLLFGLEWLRKGVLRLAGRKARSSSSAEYAETLEALGSAPPVGPEATDWAARLVAFKGVLLEGVEIVLIVSVLASRPEGAAPAILGACVAMAVSLALAVWLRKPLSSLPETELKWLVGVLLSTFGAFFLGEGLGAGWPGGELALIYGAASIATIAWWRAHLLSQAGALA